MDFDKALKNSFKQALFYPCLSSSIFSVSKKGIEVDVPIDADLTLKLGASLFLASENPLATDLDVMLLGDKEYTLWKGCKELYYSASIKRLQKVAKDKVRVELGLEHLHQIVAVIFDQDPKRKGVNCIAYFTAPCLDPMETPPMHFIVHSVKMENPISVPEKTKEYIMDLFVPFAETYLQHSFREEGL